MSRILLLVEGQTEETFVNVVLAPHLWSINNQAVVTARLMGRSRQRDHRGGVRAWKSVEDDVIRHLRGDQSLIVTTLVDYYAMPQTGDRAWPGRAEANALPHDQKSKTIERAMLGALVASMNTNFNPERFMPFVLMHEFEALLFSDCDALSRGIYRPELQANFQAVREEFSNPEEINDSPLTAPSKRILDIVPDYQKSILGSLAILEIGLEAIRAECPHFNSWLTLLEARVKAT